MGVRVHQGSSVGCHALHGGCVLATSDFTLGIVWCWHQQFVPSCCAGAIVGTALLSAGDPSSLPSLPQTVQVRSSPWARRGLLLAPALLNSSHLLMAVTQAFTLIAFVRLLEGAEPLGVLGSPLKQGLQAVSIQAGSWLVCVPKRDMPWVVCDPASSQGCWHPGQGSLG